MKTKKKTQVNGKQEQGLYTLTYRPDTAVPVTRETVLGSAAVRRAINIIGGRISRLPINVLKRQEIDEEHYAHWLIRRPSQAFGTSTFLSTVLAHVLIHGNAYVYMLRNPVSYEVEEFVILNPEGTFPVKIIDDDLEHYELNYFTTLHNLTYRRLLDSDVLHFRNLTWDGLLGMSVIETMAEALGMGLALQKYGSVYFKNSANANFVIELPGWFKTDEQLQQFKKAWESNHQGIDKSNRMAVIQGGGKLTFPQADNNQAQFIASKQFDLITVSNVLGLPAHYLGSSVATSYNSLELINRTLLADLLPYIRMIEEELDNKLLTEVQKVRDSHHFVFDLADLERADSMAETTMQVQRIQAGITTVNEERAWMHLPPLPEEQQLPISKQDIPNDADFEEEQDEPPAEDIAEDKADRQLQHDVTRLLTRLHKVVMSGKELTGQVEVVQRQLPSVQPERVAKWIGELADELKAVTKDQWDSVFQFRERRDKVWK